MGKPRKVTAEQVLRSLGYLRAGCWHKDWEKRLDRLLAKYDDYKETQRALRKGANRGKA